MSEAPKIDVRPDSPGVVQAHARAIAVIGMACRFPGAHTVDAFRRNLEQGVESIRTLTVEELRQAGVAAEWLDHPHYVRAAPVLDEIDRFDAGFFQYSGRDAELMDPQHRLFLECAWEALENAGYAADPAQASRRPIGVFGGAGSLMGSYLLSESHVNEALIGPITSRGHIGNDKDHLCTRVAYKLNLGGPAVTVQTACSTSLVAVHLACQSLLNGECALALAGGVTVRVPHHSGYLYTPGEVLSPDGHCRAFDAQAGGTLFGSGVGIVVLKPLARALADGDAIAAVIRGSALGNDGSDKMSYWATNPQGQSAVMQQAFRQAGVDPESLGFVEAHGTATHLGDMIETYALRRAFATERRGFCALGSVKTNIGHLDAAAGIAGLIKTVLTLQHRTLYPTLHFTRPNPRIDFANGPFYVNTEVRPWESSSPRRAAVNSLGVGGTNAFVVLEEAPAAAEVQAAVERPCQLLTLAARSAEALEALRVRMAAWLNGQSAADWPQICYTAATGRAHFNHRLAVIAATAQEAAAQLAAGSGLKDGVVVAPARNKVAFLFTGQGAQYSGMGRELYDTQPVFRESIDRCAALLAGQLEAPLLELLGYTEEAAEQHIDRTENTQPALFALEYALAQLWRSWGIEPTVLLGHSVGELAAACVAGVFSLENGLTLVAARGQLMGALPQEGEMVSLLAAEARVREAIAPYSDELSIAAINGPASVVISGSRDAVLAVSELLAAEGVKSQRLTVSHAFHSPLMEPMLEEFRRVAERVTYHPPHLQLVSNVTGQLAGDEIATPDYWVRHVREAVRFADGVTTLHSQGIQILLEIGPKPVLLGMAGGDSGQWSVASGQWSVATGQWGTGGSGQEAERTALLPSLRPGQGEWQQLLASLGALYVRGSAIDWEGFNRGYSRRKVVLPTYPFQRQRYWVQSRPAGRAPASPHPLIDKVIPLPQQQLTLYEREFSVESLPFLAEHRVYGELVSPGACQIAMALSAAALHFGEQLSLTDLVLPSALVLAEGKPRTVQLFLEQQPGAVQRPFTLVSFASAQTDNEVELRTHASGRVAPLQALPAQRQLAALQQLCTEPVDLAALDARLAAAQLELGPTFHWIAQGWSAPAQAVPQLLARLARPSQVEEEEGHLLHPGLLDACFQAASLAAAPEAGGLPFALAELHLCRRPVGDSWWCHVTQRAGQSAGSTPLWEIQLFDEQGLLVLAASGFQMRAASAEAIAGKSLRREWLHTLEWRPAPLSAASVPEPDCWLWVGAVPEQPAGWTAPSYRLDSTADAQALQRQVSEIAARHASVGVVFQPAAAPEESPAPQQALQACTALLTLSQALLATSLELRLWVVTAGAQTVAGQAASKPEGTAVGGSLWGLGRTLALEEPRLRCVLVDLEPGVALQTDLLARELRTAPEAGGTERAWRAGVRYQAHLVRSPAEPTVTDLDHPVRLQLSEYGSLDALHFVPAVRRQPGPGEVEVAVKAAGLNLRDLLNTLGMLQEYYASVLGIRRAQEVGLGLELAGVVTAVGEGVAHLAPGDRVLGLAGLEGAFATCTTLPAHTLTHVPAGLSDREAATLPLAYLTAWYALVEVAQLQPGERVLIHAAAGGVGQAAVQIAQLLGAEVFATASPGKWAFLRGQGIRHLFNSRTLDFADAVRECTDGQGVDVVLNSLNGEFIPASFAALREGGRFVEIGKVGIWSAAEAAERRPDAQYRAFDLGEELAREAELASRLWGALLPHLESGALRALPCTVYPGQEAVAALRTMQQAGHVGKLVLDFTPVSPLRPEGSCLITGGLGGLGLQIAQQLVDRGARHLVLVSRRGVRTPAQQAALAQLAEAGAQVDVVQADIAQVEEVRRLLKQIPALRGIVHAAGVLDDGLLRTQNPERFAAVMQPKADAAWHLHTLTQGLELDFFVAFSSMASLVGNPGQSNYAAANGFLDGLMQARRRVGLPGLSINWGPWAEVGMAAQLGELPQGMAWISPQQGRLLFYHLLTRQTSAQVGVLPLRPQIAVPARAVGLRAELATLSAAERLQRLNAYLQDELAGVLGLAKGRAVESRARLFDLGLDSLMAVELRNKLQKGLDLQLHATLLFDYPTLELLVPYLLDLLQLDAAPAAQLREQPPVPRAAGLHEGIAIVGMGCRLPGGVETPEAFWAQLLAGFDGVRVLPDQRQRDLPPSDRHSAPRGAFLERVDEFDPTFFGLSPREVVVMDPAHRLLLETAWHALEDAGIVPASLFNQEVGIFIGGGTSSYMKLVEASGLDRNLYMATGNVPSTAAGRISYLFGLTGPSVAVDTACSSSLTAIHQACQSLRLQECRAALAGGVNLMVDAEITEMFANSNMLSEDAHCKTFDAAADGYVRGEGVALLVLKRLADAEQEGDRILAVIRGSAINQDGPSGGLTVPNGPSQERVIRRALAEAGVQPSEVGYIEAHGTGTPLGDPIEVGALGKVFAERSDPLYVGSVKTNIGHLEFAAGVAGVMKLVMALQQGLIPPHLHLQQPNPHIDWASLPVRVPTAATPWAPNAARRIGGVSSFGFSGTNAHVVVEEAPVPEPAITAAERPLHLLTLSARDDAALAAYARSYCDFLEAHPKLDLGDVTYTGHVGRSHFSHRLSVTAGSVAELREKLVAAGTGEQETQRSVVAAQQEAPRIAFLFTGQGSQYAGMGRELYETQPMFRAVLDRCDQAFQDCYGRSLVELLYPAPDTETASSQTDDLMNSHPCGQAANYALECALAELWLAWGIRPAAVLGHSLGDFAAAYAAGVLGLEEGLRLVTRRGELMEQAAGEMVAVMASTQAVAPFVEPYPDAAIGVVNGPLSVVVSGARASVAAITQALQGAGFKTRRLAIPVAAHSPMLDPVLDAFEEAVRATPLSAPKLPVVSSMTGSWVTEELTQPGYWRAHLRNTVQFAQGITTLHAAGTDIFLEVGPQSTLLGMVVGDSGQWSVVSGQWSVASGQRGTGGSGQEAERTAFLPSLRPGQSDWQQLLASLGELYVRGAAIDWEGFDRGYSRRKLALPTYPFQRQRYWVQSRPAGRAAAPLRPLIDQMTPLPALQTVLFETEFSVEALPFLADHRVYGEIVSPGACQIVLALHAAQLCLGEGTALKLEDVVLPQPLVLPEGQRRSVQALFKAEQAAYTFQLVSLLPAGSEHAALSGSTAIHASGQASLWKESAAPTASLAALRQRCSQPVDLSSFYTGLEAAQIALGPSFRWLEAAWRSAATVPELLVRLAQPPAVESLQGYLLHPGLLDGCFQAAGLFNTSGETLLPFALESLAVQRPATEGEWWCHVTQRSPGRFDLVLLDAAGSTVVQIGGFQMRAASAAAIRGRELWQEWLYTVDWQPRPYFGLPPEFLLPPDQQVAAWQAHARVSDAERSQEAALHAAMEEVSLAFVLSAFRKAGLQLLPGALWRSEHFAGKLSLLPAYRRLLERLLEMLVEAAILQLVPAGWQVLRTPEPTEPAELLAALQVEHGKRPELRLLGRCAARLHDVLRGAQEPLELLFPGGDATEATQLYSDTPTARVLNGLVQRAVSSACAQLPAERGLRILEIGAGTGGTTAGLLPLLPADRSEYLFTDIGPTFLNKAQERFSAFPFVHYQPLNIEEAPAAQNLAHLQADLIVAANVLHATRNLDDTLAHLRQLLQPGGQLLLLEATERRRWLDLTFGLTDGWWRYADSRQGHPLLSPQEWQALLQAHGFAQVELLELDGQAVILAEADSLPSRLPEQSWLILADRQGVGAALASQLHRQGDQVQLVYAAHSAPPPEGALSLEPSAPAQEWQQLLASSWQTAGRTGTAQLPRLHGVVHLWSLDTPALPAALRQRAEPDEKISLDLVAAAEPAVASALQLAQALLQAQVEPAGLWLVTRDSQPVGPAEPLSGVLQSALWGLGKVIGLEHPELQPRCVDLSQDEDVQTQATRLRVELLHPGEDRQIALRSDARYLARLQRCTEQRAAQELALPAGPYRLDISERGLLDALQLRPLERRAPAAGEVEIEVQADGMNFLDVLDVLGLLPFQREALGGECAGTVVRLGDEHSGLAVGDRVAALASGGFRQFVTVSAALVVPIPDVLTFAEAASIPINFLTAWYALQRFSPLRAGARVLIHAAAGGTGMAAVKIAQAAGAEVYATASPAKWAVLRSLGVQHLYPSRTLDFRGQVLEDTDGAGVDFVLNSLTGEGFVESSLALLAPGGRFVEIAKRNIWSEDAVRAFRADVAYHILDVRAEIQNHPHEIRQQLQELLARFESGELPPVPCTTYPISQAISAFRTMQQGQHIGKIVLTAPLHRQKVSIRADATYLITGGLGGLGLASARWLAEEGARHLLLVGRSAPRAEAQAQLQALAELGVQVTVAQADVTDRTQLRAVLGQIDARCPLAGVIHSVGVLDDGALLQQRWERFVPVLAPKLQGAWNLHELTAELPLEFFVLFSSIAGLFGSRGQANHAAANAFLDSFAHYRRQQGLPALSINWGAWSEIGAAAGLVRSAARPLAEQGLGAIDPAQGIASFAWLLSQPVVQAGVAPVQWNTFLQTRKDAFYAGMHQIADRPAAVAAPTTSVRQQLERAPAKERRQLLQGVLRQAVAHVLGLQDPQRIDTRQGLLEMGLDSLMAVELRNQLARTLQQPLPSTLVFDYPTIDALTDFLLQRLGEQQAEPPQTAQPLQPAPDTVSDTAVDAIAVIGMACRFPGGSDTPERFWQLLAEERDAVIALPEGRRALMSATTTAPYYGGFLQEVDTFDPAFFGISPREARLIDPQQRLLLEVGWEALERAGLQPERLFNRPVGVFVGSCSNDYALLVRQQTVDSAQMELHQITGMAQASIAGRLAYLLGFTGPAMVVDTACSSSLVALHQACQSLRSQECDLALAGGVNLILADDWVHPNAEHDKRMHAPDGRCKTFDASADGFGRGEGCGVVVLKRLSQALAEGDTILGVVRGSMVNQDGRSSGFSAPNGPSQQQVIRQAHARAGVQPAQVGYIEAHGTGTALGDPIEVSALSAVFAERTTPLWVGSVKSNIAHLEGAAGIAGVIKVLLSFQQGQIPPNVHFHSPNPYIDWEHSPVQVPVAPVAWGTAEKIAGVSSFGISGTNAHVVLAQAPARAKKMDKPLPTDRRPLQLFTLSARDAAALAAYARSYCDFLEAHPELDLGDIAYTGHVGRSHFSHRLSVKAGSVAELREKLVAAGTGEQETQRGVVAAQQEAPRIAFLFTGQGSQYAGMGRELYETEPMFRESIDRCAALLAGQLEAPLLELLGYGPAAENAASAIDRTENTQPALFALEYALAQLWRSWGVEPEILLGHSVGELAAACVAGVFSLEDGLMLVAARGRLMGALPQEGEMVSLLAAEARVREAIAPYSDELSIAAINGPASVVISGSRDAVLAVSELLAAEGVKSQRLTVSHAFHSPLMEPMLEEFRRVAERVTYHPPHLQLVSNVTGQLAGDEIATAEYWVRHVREAVRFADGVAALHSQGVQIFLEIGPKPVLLGMAGGDSGQWSVVSGQWSVVSGQWPVVSGEQGAVARKQREWLFCPRSALARGSGSSC